LCCELLGDKASGVSRKGVGVTAELEAVADGAGPPPPLEASEHAENVTAFVLGGGGNLGAVQVGMLYALVEEGIRPDFVVGTSIGALNGAYLAGHCDLDGIDRLGKLWSEVRRPDVFPVSVRGLVRGVLGRRDHFFDELRLRALMTRAEIGFARLEEAPIPIHVVATDLLSGDPVVLSTGDTLDALLASSAIPGVFSPVNIGSHTLVDGGLVANLPVTQAVQLGATRLFVLPTVPDTIPTTPRSAVEMLQRSMTIATAEPIRRALVEAAQVADLHMLPVPALGAPSMFNFRETSAMIENAYVGAAAWLHADLTEQVS
jgi:NTE family protein